MRVGFCIAIGLASVLMIQAVELDRAVAVPFRGTLNAGDGVIRRIDDTCWWWGLRWQYGWRGYGWYPCWEWPKPAPTVIAPDAVPERTSPTEACLRVWHDASGYLHRRRIC